jgi:hypothetical protein
MLATMSAADVGPSVTVFRYSLGILHSLYRSKKKRGYVNVLRIGAILVCFAIAVPSVHAQSDPKDAAVQKGAPSTAQPGSYPDTVDGLHALLQQIVSALQTNDAAQAHTLTHNMILPDYQTWFPQVFGPELGAHIAKFYEKALPDFDAIVADAISRFVGAGPVEITVTRFQPSELPEKETYAAKVIKAMQNPVPIYTVGINKPGEAAGSVPGFFAFVQGSFRYVGWHAMRAQADSSRWQCASGQDDSPSHAGLSRQSKGE